MNIDINPEQSHRFRPVRRPLWEGLGRGRSGLVWVLAGLWCLGALTPTASVLAQEPKVQSVPRAGKPEGPEAKLQQKNLRMNEVEILGEVEKPKTMFVIPRAPHQYFWEEGKKDFTEEILSPISKQRVEGMEQWREDALPP